MKQVALASAQQRSELFLATASQMGITPAAVEKDFWIVWLLQQLFGQSKWQSVLRFKGGTSLSKAYGIIARFSEDIDLILDWRGLSEANPLASRSKTQQQKLNDEINQNAQAIIRQSLLPDLQAQLIPICTLALDEPDPHTLNMFYPALFSSGYLRPVIRLEIGPLAAMLPMQYCKIESYAARQFPKLFSEPAVAVPTITLARSFWEKITILHAEAHRPKGKVPPSRYTRHYYDVWCLAQSAELAAWLDDIDLLKEVVAFKQRFYPAAWANYEEAALNRVSILPNSAHLAELEKDYQAMKEMIFGEMPSFENLLADLHHLQTSLSAREKK